MGKLTAWILLLFAAVPAALAFSGPTATAPNVRAHLESEVLAVAPAQSFTVALVLDIADGWHTYWRNPGDSGQPTRLEWSLPPGFAAGPIEWPTPHRFVLAPLVNFGYAHRAVHLVRITAPAGLGAGASVPLRASAHWLVCSNLCIPESADLELALPVSAHPGRKDPRAAALFDAARAELPRAAPGPATAAVNAGRFVLTLGPAWSAALAHVRSLEFVPYEDGAIAYPAPQVMTRGSDSIELATKAGYQPPRAGEVAGVLIASTGDDAAGAAPRGAATAYQISARLTAVAAAPAPTAATAAAGTPPAPAPSASAEAMPRPVDALTGRGIASAEAPMQAQGGGAHALWALLGLAVLGGLVLNLMPCVLPVLSIKAVGLAEQAKKHPREVRVKALVFAAGVIASMLALSGVLLVLRAGGEQIGWGFQLQSPLFVTLMAYLLLAVGLNLSGVFEIGGGLTGLGEGLTHGESLRAAFFTGTLTTLVATPCTAPFMAAAVGAAIAQPAPIALAIFAALGAGLALPLVLLSFAPWLRRALPKPGAWMDTLKQVLAFPMYASAAWLLWVLSQQTSSLGLASALAGFVLVGLAAWSYQRARHSARHGRAAAVTAALAAAAALVAAVVLPIRLEGAPAGAAGAASAARADGIWEPYDPARVAALRAEGRPVLVNFTASWCLTCLVNERAAFGDPTLRATLRDKGVTLIKGDWTNGDPRITRALARFGRAGVPLYVVYNANPGSSRPLVLPQLLTASVVEQAFAALPDAGHLH